MVGDIPQIGILCRLGCFSVLLKTCLVFTIMEAQCSPRHVVNYIEQSVMFHPLFRPYAKQTFIECPAVVV